MKTEIISSPLKSSFCRNTGSTYSAFMGVSCGMGVLLEQAAKMKGRSNVRRYFTIEPFFNYSTLKYKIPFLIKKEPLIRRDYTGITLIFGVQFSFSTFSMAKSVPVLDEAQPLHDPK